jgi:hypothetical protein
VDHRAELLSQVERVLDGTLSVSAFDARFYDYYIDEVPDDALESRGHDFVSAICEKLDFTVENPAAEARRGGWIDHAQFLAWLRAHHAAFDRS